MRLLAKRTFGVANVGYKSLLKQCASSSSCQYIETPRLEPSATMSEPISEESPDLSKWSADQLIARVAFLERQLKEQTAKCVRLNAPLRTILIA